MCLFRLFWSNFFTIFRKNLRVLIPTEFELKTINLWMNWLNSVDKWSWLYSGTSASASNQTLAHIKLLITYHFRCRWFWRWMSGAFVFTESNVPFQFNWNYVVVGYRNQLWWIVMHHTFKLMFPFYFMMWFDHLIRAECFNSLSLRHFMLSFVMLPVPVAARFI